MAHRRILNGIGLLLLVTVAFAAPVAAQEEGPPPGLPEVPVGQPGDRDLEPTGPLYGQYAEAVAALTEIEDFGKGSELTGGCFGMAWSYDDEGVLIDAAADFDDAAAPVDLLDGGQAFTASNPFEVHANGAVVYGGTATAPDGNGPLEHNWYIRTQGISLDSGGDDNPEGKNMNAGMVDLAENLPLKFTGLVRVDGAIESINGLNCSGRGFVKFVGPFPLMTVPGGVGLALVLVAGLGLLFNARPAVTWKG